MIYVIPGTSCQVSCRLWVLGVKSSWLHAGTVCPGSESTERSEREVLLKGVSSEGTGTGPVGSERGCVQQPVLVSSKSGDRCLQRKGTQQARAGSSRCPWCVQKLWHLRNNLKADISPEKHLALWFWVQKSQAVSSFVNSGASRLVTYIIESHQKTRWVTLRRGKKKRHKSMSCKNKAKENGGPWEQNLTCLLPSYVHFFCIVFKMTFQLVMQSQISPWVTCSSPNS